MSAGWWTWLSIAKNLQPPPAITKTKDLLSSTHHFFLLSLPILWILSRNEAIAARYHHSIQSPWNTLPTTCWWPQPSCYYLLQVSRAFNLLRPRWLSETNTTTSLRPLMIFGPKMWFRCRSSSLDQKHPPRGCKCQMLWLQKPPTKRKTRDSLARYVIVVLWYYLWDWEIPIEIFLVHQTIADYFHVSMIVMVLTIPTCFFLSSL